MRTLRATLRPNTRLVLVSHASNVSGTLFPLEAASDICRRQGIPLAVDAAQTAGHLPIDFEALGLAALCVPGHKGLLGPPGIGALMLSRDFARQLAPIVAGGTGSASDSEETPPFLPYKLEPGTPNLPRTTRCKPSHRARCAFPSALPPPGKTLTVRCKGYAQSPTNAKGAWYGVQRRN